jgi:hypothetical protein
MGHDSLVLNLSCVVRRATDIDLLGQSFDQEACRVNKTSFRSTEHVDSGHCFRKRRHETGPMSFWNKRDDSKIHRECRINQDEIFMQ